MLSPSPLDAIIQAKLQEGSQAQSIAQAIAASPMFIGAISIGLGRQASANGPSQAQMIREEIVKAIQGSSLN